MLCFQEVGGFANFGSETSTTSKELDEITKEIEDLKRHVSVLFVIWKCEVRMFAFFSQGHFCLFFFN